MTREGRPPAQNGERAEPHPIAVFLAVAVVVMALLLLAARVAAGSYDPAAIAGPVESTAASSLMATTEPSPPAALPAASRPVETQPVESPVQPAPDAVPIPPLPWVSARSYSVIEQVCGAELAGMNQRQRLPPASLTKIITAIVAKQHLALDSVVNVQVSAAAMAKQGSSVMGIEPGDRLPVIDLLYGLFLPSGNDAALALAEQARDSGAGDFVALMNDEAAALGLGDTHFANPHGLDAPGQYSTALDMAQAGRALLNDSELTAISTAPAYMPAWDGPVLKNGNKLLQMYPGAYGVKIGFTELAGQTIVAAAEREGRQLVLALLGSKDRYSDAAALFDWAFASTVRHCLN